MAIAMLPRLKRVSIKTKLIISVVLVHAVLLSFFVLER